MKKTKKIIALALCLVVAVGFTAGALASKPNNWLYSLLNFGQGTTYYVDSAGGDDSNSGTSEGAAWKTLDKVNSQEYSAGDKILFKSGCIFIGQLMFKGSGSLEEGAIVVGKYGGTALPVIDANGTTENNGAVIRLYNQEYIEISDLELINNSEVLGVRNGIYVIAEDFGVADHIYIKNCNIHDVLTNARKETVLDIQANGGEADYTSESGASAGGIIYAALKGGAMIPTAFNDVLIDNNTIVRTGTNGTGIAITSEWKAFVDKESSVMQEGYLGEAPFFGSTNILICNNDLKNTASAIRLQGVDGRVGNGVIAEYNVSYKADNCDSNSAMWANNSYNVIWQYNEVYDLDNGGMRDCGAFDADGYSENTIFQYNYTHNNRGEPIMFCNIGWTDYYDYTNTTGSIFRYNISQNDMWGANSGHGRLWIQKGARNNWFYNNVIYVGEGLGGRNISIAQSWENHVYNNVFINLSDKTTYYIESANETAIDNNCFYGYHPESEPEGKDNIIVGLDDPMPLVDPGKGGIGLDTLQGYMLTSDSVLKGAGKVIENNGNKDFYGNAVSTTAAPDIGVHQTNSSVDTYNPTLPTNVKAEALGYDSIKVTWNAATDNVAISHYVIFIDGKPVGRADGNSTEWTADNLHSNTEYSFTVRAFDARGNSKVSSAVKAKTATATAAELKLSISKSEVYNEAGSLSSAFGANELVAPRFTVVDGNGRLVKNALVTVLVAAESQKDYITVTDMTDANGIAQTGFYTDIYRGAETPVEVKVKNIAKSGHTYSGSSSVNLSVRGIDDSYFVNRIKNSDFEDTLAYNWSVSNEARIVDGVSYNQSRALEFKSNQRFSANASQSLTNVPNGIYTLTYYVKNVGADVSVTLSGYGDTATEAIPISEEWQQVAFSDISVTTGKINLAFNVKGDASTITYLDDVVLSMNLMTNPLYTKVHPFSKLPSDYYYITDNGTVGEDGSNIEQMLDDTSLKAVNIATCYTANNQNALKIGANKAFKVNIGQTLKNVPNGVYTLKLNAVNQSNIKAHIAVKNYGGEEKFEEIKMSSGFEVTKLGGINVTNNNAVIELRFEGEGNPEESIIISDLSFTAQTDYPDYKAVIPADYNILSGHNPSFEYDGAVTTTLPTGWLNTWSMGKVSCIATNEYANTGDYSCKIVLHHDEQATSTSGSKNTELTLKSELNTFTNLPIGYYSFSLWAKGDFAIKMTATANGSVGYEKYTNISNTWQKIEINDILVTNGQLSIGLFGSKNENQEFKPYTVYIDDVSLTRSIASYDIAEQLSIPDVENGQNKLAVENVEGFDIGIVDSSNKNVIAVNGRIKAQRDDIVVAVTLCISNKAIPEDISYKEINVKVLGLLDDNAPLSYILGDANYDSTFDIRDIVRLKKYIAAAENNINFAAVDDDQNGILSSDDIVALAKTLLSDEGYGAFAQGEALWNDKWDEFLNQ